MALPHTVASLLFATAQVFLSSAAIAADSRTAFTFPAAVAGFHRGEPIDFESRQPGLGIGIPYGVSGVKVTVYVYNLRLENLPEGIESNVIRAQLRQAQGDVFNAYSNVQILADEAPGTGSCSSFLRMKFGFEDPRRTQAQKFHSYLYLGSRKGNFVKARITYSAETEVITNEEAQGRFAQALCKLVNE
jgi:hypothetical protein